ncbi:Spx/MgsR family RNA polymerase-binding regulatory protein [Thorsellia kenyensis]|uniref:Spx/MgsR family RNA polymerase-binding regulatory protein n=1 Tax=Thorsellia kenyensis TaxID=1549888 RepID=A0ABV6CCB1_9GAMM
MSINNIKVFGIKNCDKVKKAQNWLSEHEKVFEFIDYTKATFDDKWYLDIIDKIGLEEFVNKKSTTWRALDAINRENASSVEKVIPLLRMYPKLMKRPILCIYDDESLIKVAVGFNEISYLELFNI